MQAALLALASVQQEVDFSFCPSGVEREACAPSGESELER
jgi:hypothetical protein